ncbi:VCBS repeat-containing protein [Muricauda sp. 2012CJ35-5]|uniref:VCBS repeat-containing protein n=1 Tax=Flagellimonas spongiicola TaxID=2942208 RepID=A0ABT0PQW6_9FLAO|nr:VCBS repeat-containing protein [Allomuricauda spongiicola]MCL6273780.1 VCBS repeat-containing protein [Allomuricauda spongiicola]
MKTYFFRISIIVGLLLASCHQEPKPLSNTVEKVSQILFKPVPSDQSGVMFTNSLPESAAMNSMVYEYFYNGGGVAIGDINNDGLEDLYFTANLTGNKLYLNKGNLKFEDVTEKAGVKGSFGWTTGVSMADVNADGWLDIYVCKSGKGKVQDRENLLFINNQDGTFTEQAAIFGLNFAGYSTQSSFFDYDRDGDLDLFLLNHNVNPINTNNPGEFKNEYNEFVGDRLYRNDNGIFTDVSQTAGILQNIMGFGLGVSMGDVNNDNWPDIYVGNDYIEQDYLYINKGDGTFREQLKSAMGHTSNFSMGTDMADINNDGFTDIMSLDMVAQDNYGIKTSMSGMNPEAFNLAVDQGFHYQYMYNALQLNNGNNHFSDIAQLANVSSTDWSWAPLLADLDNDGLKDLFVTNGLKRDFRNNDFKKYKLERLKKAQHAKENMATVMEELVRRTPERKTINYIFKNNGDLTFVDQTTQWGITIPTFSNGAAYADLDNDGDLELVINNVDEPATVLENLSTQNHLQITLKGSGKNRFGVGAKVSLKIKDRAQTLENYPTRGYQSSMSNVLHFGVGDAENIEILTILWPDGKQQSIHDIPANQRLTLNYADAQTSTPEFTTESNIQFTTITNQINPLPVHQESAYNDFKMESLLPHKMSEEGPALAIGDINQDGLDDFFIGGSKAQMGKLYTQNADGNFDHQKQLVFEQDKFHEDVDAVFFDADKDGDLDLYVVSGSNEEIPNSEFYKDRIYLNVNGNFQKSNGIFNEVIHASGSVVVPHDFDHDGDMDLFVGGRQTPGKYPFSGKSFLWRNDTSNGQLKFTNTNEILLEDLGMVTDATWTDVDGDGWNDLVIVGEWLAPKILKNIEGSLSDASVAMGIHNQSGWWFSVKAADFDNDGDMDLIAGNLGLNSKYKAAIDAPFEIYSKDFDQTGSLDIVLGYHQEGKEYPLRGRECSSNQMPFIKKKFPTYHDFASASLEDVYGKENLASALHYKANSFATTYFENNGNGQFMPLKLPNLAQQTTITEIIAEDVNDDGNLDVLLFGNLFGFEVETPRQDSGYGILLLGDGEGNFQPQMPYENGLYVKGDVVHASAIELTNHEKALLITKNQDSLQLVKLN